MRKRFYWFFAFICLANVIVVVLLVNRSNKRKVPDNNIENDIPEEILVEQKYSNLKRGITKPASRLDADNHGAKPVQHPIQQDIVRTRVITNSSQKDEVTVGSARQLVQESTLTKNPAQQDTRTKISIQNSVQQHVVPTEPTTSCSKGLSIHPKGYVINGMVDTVCKPHIPPESACSYTRSHFASVPGIEKCKDQAEDSYNLCELQETKSSTPSTKLTFKCDLSVCDWTKGIYIERLEPSTGRMVREKVKGTTQDNTIVEQQLLNAAESVRKNGFPFLFVNCTGQGTNKIVAQLLTFLPSLPPPTKESWSEKININIVLIDSVSRAHFYRSLPKTVDYLRSVQTDPNFNAHVFDYELFQAVHGHTHECERALFDGILFPGNVSTKQRDATPIHLDVLFNIFKDAGYQTMFLDDLCWLGYYGLRDKYKASSWAILQEKLKTAPIDSIGFTDASCAILHRLNKNSGFFNTPNDQICFNGKHQHHYLFEYLSRYLDTNRATPRSKPLFSYTSTHVSHDSRGLRVQSMDTDLKSFIGAMATKEDTLTIIFADHGNTYTYYQVQEHEGRREMYHPSMLVVLPKPLAQRLGENVVSNLHTNQYRLFNLFDVREGIIELSNFDGKTKMTPKGIFGPISKIRTCDDLSMTTSSICLCQSWEMAVGNTTERLAPAEFAIGELNNKIQIALLDSRGGNNVAQIGKHVVFGACHRLRVQEIGNVRTRRTRAGMRTTTMDITVQSGTILNQRELITVQVSFDDKATESSSMRLVSYNRISRYGPYEKCADAGVNLKMCVCDEPGTEPKHQSLGDVVDKDANIIKLHECVLAVHRTRRSKTVVVDVYEVANICDARSFTATLEAIVSGIPFSTKLPSTTKLHPRTMYFIASSKSTVEGYPTTSPIRWKIQEQT